MGLANDFLVGEELFLEAKRKVESMSQSSNLDNKSNRIMRLQITDMFLGTEDSEYKDEEDEEDEDLDWNDYREKADRKMKKKG